jgi:hypothetical protein
LRKEFGRPGLYQDMRPTPIGWFFVTVWAVVCVLLAFAILAVTVLA